MAVIEVFRERSKYGQDDRCMFTWSKCVSCLCSCFQNNVEIHVAHIQSGLSQLGNLHAFAANNTNTV